MATLQCNVVSVNESIFSGTIKMLIAKGVGGELGIMPGHTPLITLLQPGPVRAQREDGSEEVIYVSGGVLEVQPHVITLLADSAIRADDLNEAQILEARKHAETLLANQSSEMNTGAALASLAETAAQLRTLQKLRNRA